MFQRIPLDGKRSQKKNGSDTPIINCGRTFLGPTMASTIESRNKATIAIRNRAPIPEGIHDHIVNEKRNRESVKENIAGSPNISGSSPPRKPVTNNS